MGRKHLEGYNMENTQTKVNVTLGYTMNLGNFQSLRIDIGVEDQLRDGEQVQEGFDRVYGFVEQQLAAKLKEAQSEIVE
jgi:methyl coenzyme M reductase subunit D